MHPCMNDVNDGCLTRCEGTSEKILRVPGRNGPHHLRNTRVNSTPFHKNHESYIP